MKLRSNTMLVIGSAIALAAATPGLTSSQHTPRYVTVAASSRVSDPELSPLEPLAGLIGQLGESKYASTYAGVQIVAGKLEIYVLPDHDASFLAAVAAIDRTHLPYAVNYVGRSYASQAKTSQWLLDNRPRLRDQGIIPEWWGPDAASDAVRVALQAPTNSQLAALRIALARARNSMHKKRSMIIPHRLSVTRNTFAYAAAVMLNSEVPYAGEIRVLPQFLGPGRASSSTDDDEPFYGADQIWYTLENTHYCTSNFSFKGVSDPSNHYVVTAAHCSDETTGHDFYTCHTINSSGYCDYDVGTVHTVFYNDNDFEQIPSSSTGYVWDDSTNATWGVNGYIVAEQGDGVSTDGATSGLTTDITVAEGGGGSVACYGGHCVSHAIVLSSNQSICPPGDSGGPILQRESSGDDVKAAGIILGYGSSMGTYFCYGQQVYWIMDDAGIQLILES